VKDDGPWVLEVAGRSIGGLCSRTLRFGTGMTLEEIILRHALGWPIASLARERRPAGVMMIPIPRAGRLTAVDGVAAAEAWPASRKSPSPRTSARMSCRCRKAGNISASSSRAPTARRRSRAACATHARLAFTIA